MPNEVQNCQSEAIARPSDISGWMSEPFVTGVQFSNVPIIFVDVTSGGNTIAMANTRFMQMTGFDQKDVIGKSICAVFEQITDRSSIEYMTKRLVEEEPGTWEIACQRADGSSFLATMLMHPLRNISGLHHQHIVSFYTSDNPPDLASANTRDVHLLYQHAPGFIATSEGPEHRITFANDTYKLFVGIDDLVGKTVAEALPEIAEQGFVKILDGVFETGIPYRGDAVPFDLPDPHTGENVTRYCNFVYQPVRNKDRKVIGLFCEGYDVSEQIAAEKALKTLTTEMAHSSRVNAMGTMATTLAHELNQPLSAILNYSTGCLRLIEKEGLEIEVVKASLRSVKDAATRASAVIKILRDITDRKVRSSAIFDLKSVVNECVNLVRSAGALETKIFAAISPDIKLEGDRTQIQQVIINLLRNGCDAVVGLSNPKVTIAAEQLSNEVIVSVRDTGRGIAPEAQEGLFGWSESTKEGGMGLGLSICRTIIEAHGGRIWLQESSQQGAEFRFSLPSKI